MRRFPSSDRCARRLSQPLAIANGPRKLTLSLFPTAMDFTRAQLYFSTNSAPRHPCERCGANVVSELPPYLCRNHLLDRVHGWAYITRRELSIVNSLREHGWTDEALATLNERILEVRAEEAFARLSALHIGDTTGSAPSSASSSSSRTQRRRSSSSASGTRRRRSSSSTSTSGCSQLSVRANAQQLEVLSSSAYDTDDINTPAED